MPRSASAATPASSACQSENNVAVVGPEEVARGRDMHWLRVDVYDHGSAAQPKPGFQPVPCMHCEHAPCEPVCPVAASVHDGEGLNLQVYNRCVGTRFCEANCPYKVRRFNFFGYADGEEYANLGFESYRAQKNPEVTVRARGVMEKCTYCVQRISGARRAAERDDRPIGLDEVKTACQSACPTSAITLRRPSPEGIRRSTGKRPTSATMRCSGISARARAPPISQTSAIPRRASTRAEHERRARSQPAASASLDCRRARERRRDHAGHRRPAVSAGRQGVVDRRAGELAVRALVHRIDRLAVL